MKKTLFTLGILLILLSWPLAIYAAPVGSQTDIGMDQDLLLALISFITSSGPGADLLDFTTRIGAGVERSAAGIEDNPLTDLIGDIETRFGFGAANTVEQIFNKLIEVLGPSLLADVDPIVLNTAPYNFFDIDNGRADVASVSLPMGPYILDIGNTHNVGNGEFSRIVLGLVDSDGDDNDADQLLHEIFTGVSGANLDFEQVPGIVGVDLAGLSLKDFTLAISDGDATDMLTFYGPGTEAVLTKLDAELGLPVPEPGTALLLCAGLMVLAGLKRKKS